MHKVVRICLAAVAVVTGTFVVWHAARGNDPTGNPAPHVAQANAVAAAAHAPLRDVHLGGWQVAIPSTWKRVRATQAFQIWEDPQAASTVTLSITPASRAPLATVAAASLHSLGQRSSIKVTTSWLQKAVHHHNATSTLVGGMDIIVDRTKSLRVVQAWARETQLRSDAIATWTVSAGVSASAEWFGKPAQRRSTV